MDLTPYFLKGIEGNLKFNEALEIARRNSREGGLWVIGGTVFRTIVQELYGVEGEESYDFDFIIENPVRREEVVLPTGWSVVETGLGSLRFMHRTMQVDFVSLCDAMHSSDSPRVLVNREERLQSYFKRTPLTVQSIAYDVLRRSIVGDIGIRAILEKTIAVNYFDECLQFCRRRRISVYEFMSRKGSQLQFKVIFPDFSKLDASETKEFYDIYAIEYADTRGDASFTQYYLQKYIDTFLSSLPGTRILDLGSGPGRDALILKERGFSPTCIDISDAMISLCKEKGLEAFRGDIEGVALENNSFDGAWAYASLVHIPKIRIYNALARIYELLKLQGLFFCGVIEGDSEVFYESTTKPGKKRFFALYHEDEFRNILSQYFEVLDSTRFTTGAGETYLNYLCRKRDIGSYPHFLF